MVCVCESSRSSIFQNVNNRLQLTIILVCDSFQRNGSVNRARTPFRPLFSRRLFSFTRDNACGLNHTLCAQAHIHAPRCSNSQSTLTIDFVYSIHRDTAHDRRMIKIRFASVPCDRFFVSPLLLWICEIRSGIVFADYYMFRLLAVGAYCSSCRECRH